MTAQQRTKDTTRHIKFLINNLPAANLPGEVVVDTLNEINTGKTSSAMDAFGFGSIEIPLLLRCFDSNQTKTKGGFMSLGSSFFNTLLKSSLDKDNSPENAIKLVSAASGNEISQLTIPNLKRWRSYQTLE